ncbi:MAG: hypothetical protein AAF757_06110 [Cyanobacteria bacterium P01_D01_bin.116]
MANKLLNFRCPPELLEAIDALGVQRYPSDNDNGCDRTKTLLDIIEAGIEALNDGTVDIPISKTECKTGKADIDPEELKGALRAELVPEFNAVLNALRDEFEYKSEQMEQRLKKLKV